MPLLEVVLNKETVESCPNDSFGYLPMDLVFKMNVKKGQNFENNEHKFLERIINLFFERAINLNRQNENIDYKLSLLLIYNYLLF